MFKINNLTAFFFTYFCPRFYGSPPSPSANTSTVSTTTTAPWGGAAKLLTNGNSTWNKETGMMDANGKGPQGLYQQIGNYATQYGDLTPQQLALQAGNDANLAGRSGTMNGLYGDSTKLGGSIAGGAYDTHFGQAGNASLTNSGMTNAGMTNAEMTNASLTTNNFGQSMANMGAVDPTSAMSNVLRGDPTNNPYLAQMNQANVNTAMRGYNDAIQNVNQQVMPGINNDAFAAGQYGGSRQGIAQGLALQGMDRSARDLGIAAMDSGNQLYGSAFQNAQNNQATAANQMTGYGLQNGQFNAGQANDMSKFNAGNAIDISKFNAGNANQNSQFNAGNAIQNSQFNAGNANQNSQFNANLGLQNQVQQMAQNAQNLGNATAGNELNNTAATRLFAGQDQTYGSQMSSANLAQQQKLDMLNMQLGALTPGANLGGSTTATATQPYYDNTLGNIGGMAAGAGGLISALKGP